ncbi:MAG: helix-turn-helix domain-containing protein [Rhodospirillaceae bacterium]|nr:helix-turn-helix domain-containing protein [Rhodospirillaceae bacterium]
MAGKSPLQATASERSALETLAGSGGRAEADRARAVLLTLAGWTSNRISQAFGVREDTVRLWRSDFMRGGVDALRTRVAAGPAPVKAEAALRVAAPLLCASVADRTNWTLARLAGEVEKKEGVTISLSQLSKVLRKKGGIVTGGQDTR